MLSSGRFGTKLESHLASSAADRPLRVATSLLSGGHEAVTDAVALAAGSPQEEGR